MKTILSLSALQPSQYRQYAKGWKPDLKLLEIFEQQSHKRGKKAYRIYFDYVLERVVKIPDSHVPSKIAHYLRENGFELLDYAAGTVKDKHNRVLRLGKVISKEAELKKLFDNDANRRQIVTAAKGKKLVCLSMHPYDIAGMSTDRGWTSCMNLLDGSNKKYVKHDVKGNTLIAYMVNNDDKNLNSPIMRVLLKKFSNANGSSYRYIAEVAYPDSNDTLFVRKVQAWVDENINAVMDKSSEPTVLKRKKDLYDDGSGDFVLSGLDKLVGKSLDVVEKALDKMLDKAEDLHSNTASTLELFSKIPEAINYKNITKLVGRAGENWVNALEDKSNRIKLIRESFMRFKPQRKPEVAYDVMSAFVKKGDFEALAATAEYVPVERFLQTGATDFLVERMMEKPTNAGKVVDMANELAKFSMYPDTTFWQVITRVCDPDSLAEFMEEGNDSINVYYLPTIMAMAKFNSPYFTLASLSKVEGKIPKEDFKIWNFMLTAGEKTIVPFKFADYSIFSYKDRMMRWDDIAAAMDKFDPKPTLIVHSIESSSKTPQYFCFNKTVSKEAVTNTIRDALNAEFSGATYSETVPFPTSKTVGNCADLILCKRNGTEVASLRELVEDAFSVGLHIYEDEKTHIPMVKFTGTKDDVREVIGEAQYLINGK